MLLLINKKSLTPTLSEFSFKPLIMTLKQITPSSLPPTLTICGSRILFSSSFPTPKPQLSILRFYTQENVMKVALFLSFSPSLSLFVNLHSSFILSPCHPCSDSFSFSHSPSLSTHLPIEFKYLILHNHPILDGPKQLEQE